MYNLSINNIAIHGFTFLQETVLETVKNNSKRIVAIALIALGCLTLLYAAYQDCFTDPYDPSEPTPVTPSPFYVPPAPSAHAAAFSSGALSQFQGAILAIQPQKKDFTSPKDLSTVAEEKKCIKAIKSNWLDDPQKELTRILDAKLFPDSIQKAIYQPAMANVSQIFSVLGRALEIKNLYRHSHYVFTHGQAPELSFANLLIRECVRVFTPLLNQPLKIPFRLPHTVTYSENADDFIKKYNATANSITFSDNNQNMEMISVDAQFWNGDACESALDFFSTAKNINLGRGDSELVKIFKSIFMNYLPNHTLCNLFAEKALKIAKQRKTETLVGVLYAICIPKDIVKDEKKNFAYHCHPFGKQCNCFPGKDRIGLLEEMQNDKITRCTVGTLTQYRLLTSRLAEEKDVRSFAISALSKSKRKFYHDQAEELVKEVAQYSHLYDLIERLDEDPSVIDLINSLVESSNLNHDYLQHLFDEKGKSSKHGKQESWMQGVDPILAASLLDH